MMLKSAVKQLVPPLLLQGLHRIRNGCWIAFEGDYPSWQAAMDAAGGYDTPAILERVRTAALKVKRGEAVFERDSVCFDHEEYRWPALACLLQIAAGNRGQLHVLDFGGSLGSFYSQHRKVLSSIPELAWPVGEQPHFVQIGKEEFTDDVLGFHETIDDCLNAGKVDVIFLSSVLQYLPEPHEWLRNFSGTGVPWLLLDRTPFIDREQAQLTVQHVPPQIYPASYPAWFFSRKRFAETIKKSGYREIVRFDAMDNAGIGAYEGVLFEHV